MPSRLELTPACRLSQGVPLAYAGILYKHRDLVGKRQQVVDPSVALQAGSSADELHALVTKQGSMNYMLAREVREKDAMIGGFKFLCVSAPRACSLTHATIDWPGKHVTPKTPARSTFPAAGTITTALR